MTILLYSLALPDRRTNVTHQPGAWPVPPPICQQMTGWLARPPTHRGVLVQQPRLLYDTTNSVSTGHRTNFPHGLQAKTAPLRPGDSQWIHKEDAVHHQRSQVYDPQGARKHNALLQSKKISGPCIQTRRLGIPRYIGYQDDTSISKVVTSQTGTLWNQIPSRTVSLLSQVAPWNETVVPSVQHCKVIHCPGRSNTRKETASPTTTHYCWWRTRVGSRRDIR